VLISAAHEIIKNVIFHAYHAYKTAEYQVHYNVIWYYASKLVGIVLKLLTDNEALNIDI